MLEDECLLNVIKFEFVADNLVVFALPLEQSIVVLLLHLVLLLHHACSTCHQLHLFNGLGVLEEECHDSIEAVDEEKGPTHGRHVCWVKSLYHETLLQHLLEFVPKREGNLGSDEALENATNGREHKHMEHALHVLLQHRVHHVGVLHHVHWVGTSHRAIEVPVSFVAVERFTSSHCPLSQVLALGSDLLAAGQGLPFTRVSVCLFL